MTDNVAWNGKYDKVCLPPGAAAAVLTVDVAIAAFEASPVRALRLFQNGAGVRGWVGGNRGA